MGYYKNCRLILYSYYDIRFFDISSPYLPIFISYTTYYDGLSQGEDGRKPLVTMILLGFAMIFSFPSTEGYLFNSDTTITRENLFIILAMIPQSVYIATNVRKIVTIVRRPKRRYAVK